MSADIFGFTYAALVAVGGLIGFIKAGSSASLIAGVASGTLIGFGAYLSSLEPPNHTLSLGAAAGLTGLMGYRFIKSGKFMPAGLVAIVSVVMVVRYGLKFAQKL